MNYISEESLRDAVAKSDSIADILRYLGKNPKATGYYPLIKKYQQQYNIDTSHFTGQGWNKGLIKYTSNEVFAENSTVSRGKVRRYIIRDNLIPYQCAMCGNKGMWQGRHMALELDHINGVCNDHRLENLRFLCPNCHAISPTYCGRNKRARKSEK